MGFGEIKTLFERCKDAIRLSQPSEVDSATQADRALSSHYSNVSDSRIGATGSGGDVARMTSDARRASGNLIGKKPSMGLETPEIKKAENNLEMTENEVESNNTNAETELRNNKIEVDNNNRDADSAVQTSEETARANNQVAQEATTEAETTADENNRVAEENLENVENNSQEQVENAQSQVDSATEAQSQAQTAYDSAQNAVNSAQQNLNNAQSALSNAQTDEERQAAQEQIDAAQKALEEAQRAADDAKTALDEAQSALDAANSELGTIKQETETAISEAENQVQTTQTEGQNAINQARDNETQVQRQGQEGVQDAEQNRDTVRTEGNRNIDAANDNIRALQETGEADVEEATAQVAQAETEAVENASKPEAKPAIDYDKLEDDNREVRFLGNNVSSFVNRQERNQNRVNDCVANLRVALDEGNSENIGNALAETGGSRMIGRDNVTIPVLQQYEETYGNSLMRDINNNTSLTEEQKNSLMYDIAYYTDQNTNINAADLMNRVNECIRGDGFTNRDIKYMENAFDDYEKAYQNNLAQARQRAEQQDLEDAVRLAQIENRYMNLQSNEVGQLSSSGSRSQNLRFSANTEDTPTGGLTETRNGNGLFDGDATQETGNCWMHSTLNSMRATTRGSENINSLVYTNTTTGAISNYIPEADALNRGENNTNGIYTYNSNEIATGYRTHSSGDDEYTAYIMAADNYLENYEQRVEEGNTIYRGYELISGRNCVPFLNTQEIPEGVGTTYGINNNIYDQMENSINNTGNGAYQISISDPYRTARCVNPNDFSETVEASPLIERNHAYAVRAMTPTHVYLQESNHPDSYIQVERDDFIRNTGRIGTYRF